MMHRTNDNKTMKKDNLTPEAQRALAEAAERQKQELHKTLPPEINGRKGPEPTRYGDWENKGLTSDF
jgi:hypothetical protein